jgi:hypothetical protein
VQYCQHFHIIIQLCVQYVCGALIEKALVNGIYQDERKLLN